MTPEESWERDKYAVGRAMHEGWRRQKIRKGFVDHPYQNSGGIITPKTRDCRNHCAFPYDSHHDDMIPWEQLSPSQQAINYEGGKEGYLLGFEAGVVYTEIDFGEGYEQGYVRGHRDGYVEGQSELFEFITSGEEDHEHA